MIVAVIMVVFPFAMIFAALSDFFTMTISNRISLLLIAAFLLIAPFIGLTWGEFGMHLAAFGLVLAVTFALFAAGTLGGGDAKLMASTSLWSVTPGTAGPANLQETGLEHGMVAEPAVMDSNGDRRIDVVGHRILIIDAHLASVALRNNLDTQCLLWNRFLP